MFQAGAWHQSAVRLCGLFLVPQSANAVTATESDGNITTPDGARDCYFVHPTYGPI